MMRPFYSILLIVHCAWSFAQVTVDPVFATADDTVTIRFDASQGNAALKDLNPPVVYAHMGLITTSSSGPTDWRYVQGQWGTTDSKVLMEYKGNNIYEKRYHIRSFHGLPVSDTALQLAFVFRNASGSIVGRAADGSDIFVPIYQDSFAVRFVQLPSSIYPVGDSVSILGIASDTADLEIYQDGQLVSQATADALDFMFKPTQAGTYSFEIRAGGVSHDRIELTFFPSTSVGNVPDGWLYGINYLDDTTVGLRLHAPNKDFIFVLGDFNQWNANLDHFMSRSNSGDWWLRIDALQAGHPYAFQYWVDGELYVADPCSEVVLDPEHDKYISQTTYPGLPAYPSGGQGILSLMEPGSPAYDWDHADFTPPAEEELVIYELLVRDFTDKQRLSAIMDKLDYFERLGVNAIELMPISEFEGNLSWGYNVSYHMALDKYYGTRNAFKELVDSLHGRGIAVILDVVFNHAFSQSALCQLYWDPVNFRPAADNPWLNVEAKHPYNVGYDFNHESPAFQAYMNRVIAYWMDEFHVDGYRFDLSKGFTQRYSGANEDYFAQYDAGRIARLKYLHDFLKAKNENFYVILEHFAYNNEEIELADHGCMIWGNLHHDYKEATLGYSSNFAWADYQTRGWSDPKAVVYLESHDEERILYDCSLYGNTNGAYNVQDLETALNRFEATSMMFMAQPGPKLIWMGSELGNDVSINTNGRLGEKPFRWDHLQAPQRLRVHRVYAEMAHLKSSSDIFNSRDYDLSVAGSVKRIKLRNTGQEVIALANFGMSEAAGRPYFSHTGWWHEHFSGDSIKISNTDSAFQLQAGDYMLWSDVRMQSRFASVVEPTAAHWSVYPNPANDRIMLSEDVPLHATYRIWNPAGELIRQGTVLNRELSVADLPAGLYLLEMAKEGRTARQHMVIY